jgi:hypothetical protein
MKEEVSIAVGNTIALLFSSFLMTKVYRKNWHRTALPVMLPQATILSPGYCPHYVLRPH